MYLFWVGDKRKSFGSAEVMLCVSDHQSMLWIFEWTHASHIFLVFLIQIKSAKCSTPLDVWSCRGSVLVEQVCLILVLGPSPLISQSRSLTSKPSFPQTLANGTTNSVLLIFLSLKIQASKESNSFSHNFSERSESKAEKAIAWKLEFMWHEATHSHPFPWSTQGTV